MIKTKFLLEVEQKTLTEAQEKWVEYYTDLKFHTMTIDDIFNHMITNRWLNLDKHKGHFKYGRGASHIWFCKPNDERYLIIT